MTPRKIKRSVNKAWTKDELVRLRELGSPQWSEAFWRGIAADFPGRTWLACRKKFREDMHSAREATWTEDDNPPSATGQDDSEYPRKRPRLSYKARQPQISEKSNSESVTSNTYQARQTHAERATQFNSTTQLRPPERQAVLSMLNEGADLTQILKRFPGKKDTVIKLVGAEYFRGGLKNSRSRASDADAPANQPVGADQTFHSAERTATPANSQSGHTQPVVSQFESTNVAFMIPNPSSTGTTNTHNPFGHIAIVPLHQLGAMPAAQTTGFQWPTSPVANSYTPTTIHLEPETASSSRATQSQRASKGRVAATGENQANTISAQIQQAEARIKELQDLQQKQVLEEKLAVIQQLEEQLRRT